MKIKDPSILNAVTLAYVGDGAYEILIRQHLVESGIVRPNQLQKTATQYVSAKAQAALITRMQDEDVLTDEELAIFMRGRNAKSHTKAKNTSTATYHLSTGFEAVFGFLSLNHQDERVIELTKWCIEKVESGANNEYRFK
ncbi:Mini-ribonuclease 3 [Holzapfeliella sp. JNUCC 80]